MKKIKMFSYDETLVTITDTKGVITSVNDDFLKITNIDENDIIGNTHNIIKNNDIPDWAFGDLWNTVMKGGVWNGIISNKVFGSDSIYWFEAKVKPIFEGNKIVGFSAKRKQASPENIIQAMKMYKLKF